MRSSLKRLLRFDRCTLAFGLAFGLIMLGLSSPPAARGASLTIQPGSSGSIQFSTYNLSGTSTSPSFNSNGLLLSAGNGYQKLGSVNVPGTPTTGSIFPAPLNATSNSPDFSARTTIDASTSTQTGASSSPKAGVFFAPNSISDNQGSPGAASVSFSTAEVMIKNTGTTPITGLLGDAISVAGSVNNTQGFVEAAITGTYSVNGGAALNFNPLIVAFNGTSNSFVDSLNPSDNSVLTSTAINANGLSFSAAFSTLVLPGNPLLTLQAGDTLTITAAVTLISGQGSISFMPYPESLDILSDFGPFGVTAVPEPASLIPFLVGTSAVLGTCWGRVVGRRFRPKRADELTA
jgi:hypothetical protein